MALRYITLLVIGLTTLWLCSASSADVPHMINYQGKLTTAQGGCLNDTVQMIFTIYYDSLATLTEWMEVHPQVIVKEGVFSVLLGSAGSPIPALIFDGGIKYLGVQVGSDPEMRPLKPMVTTAYACRSLESDTAEWARAAPTVPDADWTFSGNDIFRVGGNVGIGTPPFGMLKLEVLGSLAPSYVGTGARGSEQPSASYRFGTGYENTGFSSPEPYHIAVITCGNERMRIDNAGNIGIGTPSPTQKLDVAGRVQMISFKMPTGAASGYVLTSDASGLGTWQAAAGGGDVTAVYADEGLTGGATSGDAHLNVGQGTGILVSADAVSLNTSYTDDRYVNEGQSSSITSNMIVDNAITDSDISGTASIAPAKISGTAWTATNDGSGSGLDADLVDGIHASTTPEANKLLALNNEGKFPASVIPSAAAVKSVQSGEITIPVGGNSYGTQNVAISSVNPSKSFCVAGGANSDQAGVVTCGCRLTSSTNLQIRWSSQNNQAHHIVWQVIEFY